MLEAALSKHLKHHLVYQVLKVHAENDRLKIRELEDRQKIQHLLSLSSGAGSDSSTTYFVSKPPLQVNFSYLFSLIQGRVIIKKVPLIID